MATDPAPPTVPLEPAGLLEQAERAWADGDGDTAMALFARSAELAEAGRDHPTLVTAVLGMARAQRFNLAPGVLPVRLHAAYAATTAPAPRARLAAALARCWAYASEPSRAQPFALEALELADRLDDPVLLADALDAALASHWGPDDIARRRAWALRLDDAAAHLRDPDGRLQAQLWRLTVAWETLDLPRMHRSMHAMEQLAAESQRANFFAASRRLPLELLRGNIAVAPRLLDAAERAAALAVIPDADEVLHEMRGNVAFFTGDSAACLVEAAAFEEYAVQYGVAAVRAEAAVLWLGAGRLDKVVELIGVLTPEVLGELPRDCDWLLTMQCALEAALGVSDRALVAAVTALLAPYAGRSVVDAGAVMWHGVTDDPLARAFAMLGDRARAARHRSEALATYERLGARWWRDRLRDAIPAGPAPSTAEIVLHLHPQPGGLWLVGREGATFVLPRMRGLSHLHRLVSEPDRDIPVAALVGGPLVDQSGLEVIDEQARRTYRARLAELDPRRDAAERGWLLAQLQAATGLGGRPRTASGSNQERARVAVRKAIVAALARIAETDPWLGRHLRDHVRTGLECRYESDPDRLVRWLLDARE